MRSAPVTIEAEYRIPIEHHNPMEPHAAIAAWQGERPHDLRQDAGSLQRARAPGVELRHPRGERAGHLTLRRRGVWVVAPAELLPRADGHGGACAPASGEGRLHAHPDVHRPRPSAVHDSAGRARRGSGGQALGHRSTRSSTTRPRSRSSRTTPPGSRARCTPVRTLDAPLRITDTDLNTPTWMRAPGAVSGMFALECAMDELAYALKIDPLELRLLNYAEVEPESGRPFSSKALRECYRLGAEKFGWMARTFEPRSMRDRRWLVGWGMATGIWGRAPDAGHRPHHAQGERDGACCQRDQRHRPGDLHGGHHDRRRVPRAPAGAGDVRPRRHDVPPCPRAGGLVDDGERRLRRARCGPGHRREAAGRSRTGTRTRR